MLIFYLPLGLFKSLFLLVELRTCVRFIWQGQVYHQEQKYVFFNLAGFSTFLKDLSHPWEGLRRELLNNWFAERCDFFQWRPTSSDQLQACIQKKVVSPGSYLQHLPLNLFNFLLVELIFFLRYLGETNPTNLARKRSRPLNIISDKSLLFGVAMSTCLCFSIHMCISLLAGTNVSSAFGAFQGDKFLVVTMFKFRNSNIRKK